MAPLRAVLSTFFPSYEQATQATVSWQRVCDRVSGTVPIIENFIVRGSLFLYTPFGNGSKVSVYILDPVEYLSPIPFLGNKICTIVTTY
jgi:hypothetical protein